MVGVLVLIDIITLSIWTIVDPLMYSKNILDIEVSITYVR
jgi:hypothetical protein